MGDISYKPLIEDMLWSYSRIDCYKECRYKWFLKYIKNCKEIPMFYSSYGSFMHKLIELYYKGEITKDQMLTKFLLDFSKEVRGDRPSAKIVEGYIHSGVEYLSGFTEFPFNMVDVEKKVNFEIDGYNFIGIIDYVGEKDGEYYIVDNKSRDLSPRSNRKKPTLKDAELDEMLKQLYIYSAAIKNEFGKFPKELCFNCFRTGVFIREPFSIDKYNETIEWAKTQIELIKNEEEFSPMIDFFGCKYICGVQNECCYFEVSNERRRH